MTLAARFHRMSRNRKLSPIKKVPYDHPKFKFRPTPVAPFVCSTYASIAATCPDSCAFKRAPDGTPGGCYVDADSFMHRAMLALDAAAVGKFPNGKRPFRVGGVDFIPCPAETLGKNCAICRLCLDAPLVVNGQGIAFEMHGRDVQAARAAPLRVKRAA